MAHIIVTLIVSPLFHNNLLRFFTLYILESFILAIFTCLQYVHNFCTEQKIQCFSTGLDKSYVHVFRYVYFLLEMVPFKFKRFIRIEIVWNACTTANHVEK